MKASETFAILFRAPSQVMHKWCLGLFQPCISSLALNRDFKISGMQTHITQRVMSMTAVWTFPAFFLPFGNLVSAVGALAMLVIGRDQVIQS